MRIKKWNFNKKTNTCSLIFALAGIISVMGALFCFISMPFFLNASTSNGTIDLVYKYAKGVEDSSLKIDFGFFRGTNGVVVADNSLSGYAWGQKVGWVNLYPGGGGVLNNNEGVLSGYASSEFGGWINFNGVTINSSGEFLGYATTEKLGRVIFNCSTNNSCATDNFKVVTDWRPVSVRENLPPNPTYTTPANLPPPVFTTDSIPDKENPSPTPKDPDDKPLPIGDLSQYHMGGDVIKENTITPEGGVITTIRLPGAPDANVGTTPTQPETKETPQTSTSNVGTIISTNVEKAAKDVTSFVQTTKKDAVILTGTPAIDISTKTITTVGVAGGGTAIISSITSSLLSFSEFFLGFFRLWSLLLSALGLRKRREPWGVVYDSVTKQPLDPAYVILEDKNGKEIATSITDLDGRFGFLAPPGTYRMIAKKTNYIAPSLHLHGKERDELYDNLYFGEYIELEASKTVARNIPMDPQGFDWNEFAKRDKDIMKFHSPHKKLLAQISSALFFVGLLFAVGLSIVKPDIYNIAILVLYVFLSILRLVKFKEKSYGTIRDKVNGFPLSFAIIRVYSKNTGKEMFHRVADQYGHYYCLLANGDYYITIEKKNSDESYTKVHTTDVISVKNGIINQNFSVY
ncbi:MAG: carboxypeptidase-like regulatory domain-containing protein [bacterium]